MHNKEKHNSIVKNAISAKNICAIISWLDNIRWCDENNYNFINFFRDNLTSSEKILTHWLCYITDRQMPFEIIWDKGGFVFSQLVHEYSSDRNLKPKDILDKHYESYLDKGKRKFRFKDSKGTAFASRYITDDYENILQTLLILDAPKYERNIVKYIIETIKRFSDKTDDLLIRVANSLHILTYSLKSKKAGLNRALKILEDDNEFEKALHEFKSKSTIGKKRLWCCVRDYKKGLYRKVFLEAIKEVEKQDSDQFVRIWDKLPMHQIELPGDVWNNSPLFKDNLFGSVLDINKIPSRWNMPEIIRALYDELRNGSTIDNFYPEQFDVTFDFVPRMCSKKLCKVCPFGKDGIEAICIPTKDKLCPIALINCGYLAKCNGSASECTLKANIGRGICKTLY